MEDEKPKKFTQDELDIMNAVKEKITGKHPYRILVGSTVYNVKQVSKAVASKIHALELEAYALSGKQKEALPLKKALRITRKLDRLHAKTAAYYLLGNKAIFMPWLFWLTWKRMMLRGEEHCFRINEAGGWNQEINFSSANWDISKLRLAHSMRPVGDGVRQMLKRWEAAEQQSEEDATKKKAEDSK